MQIPHTAPRTGELVRVRGNNWRVDQVTAYDRCAALTLAGIGIHNAGLRRVVLYPFDRPQPLERRERPTRVTPQAWLRALHVLAVSSVPWGSLRAAAGARLDLLPYQFEPALAVIRGAAARLLVADDVGLGKTIQAALVIAELRARRDSARALIVTPAGLREQWAHELEQRFSIPSAIIDALRLRRLSASLPANVNPWEVEPVVITSLDFVKLPEVARALDATLWDVVVVDEAHTAATARERRLAIDSLCARARTVILLTATPHAGDEAGFRSLCSLGDPEGRSPVMMFRRTANDVGLLRGRRTHLLSVTLTKGEIELHGRLNQYTRLVWERSDGDQRVAARLAMIVLRKRALSAVASLVRSIERRLAHLHGDGPAQETQLPLPLQAEAEGEHDTDDLEPAEVVSRAFLGDAEEERRLLEEILDAARAVAAADSKVAALARLLRRLNEPVIVFTEYRDTAEMVAAMLTLPGPIAVLHGGLDQCDRRAIEHAFRRGQTQALIATDAAGQGLNLHDRCRVIVNLELPWNPVRLEQRIGRVDRIGQRRLVHAFHLVARGSAEETILARLVARITAVRQAIGWDGSPLGDPDRIAATIIAPQKPEPEAALWTSVRLSPRTFPGAAASVAPPPELAAASTGEFERLVRQRAIAKARERPLWRRAAPLLPLLDRTTPWASERPCPGAMAPGVIFVFRTRLVDGCGELLEDTLTAIHVEQARAESEPERAHEAVLALGELARRWLPIARERARAEAADRLSRLISEHTASFDRQLARETAIANRLRRRLRPGAVAPAQAGLFDQRELRQAAARRLTWSTVEETMKERLRACSGRRGGAAAGEPELLLILRLTPR